MIAADYELTHEQLDIVWADLDLEWLPYPFEVPSVGETMDERRLIRDRVYRELEQHGWAVGGRLDGRLDRLLRLLKKNQFSIDATTAGDVRAAALAATDHRTAVVAVLDGDTLRLREISPHSMASSIVEIMPDSDAGPGHAFCVDADMLRAADALLKETEDDEDDDDSHPWHSAESDARAQALTRVGVSAKDATMLARITDAPTAKGVFGVSHSGGSQFRDERSPTTVVWHDTDDGCYMLIAENEWLSVTPADSDRVAGRLNEVLDATLA